MKTTFAKTILVAAILATVQRCYTQGFVNLNFENANTSGYTPGISFIPSSIAIPGWSVYLGGSTNPASGVVYDGLSLGGAIVSLQDSNAVSSGYGPIQGNYSILLQGSTVSTPTTAAIGQTGTIFGGTQSLTFFSSFYGALQVTFNGQPISYLVTGSTANYNIYAADISAFAGQTGQLLFTAAINSSVLLDNIQFSTTAVPEPSTFVLATLGGVLLGLRRWRKFS
jgi:hypothetical protein